MLHLLQPPPPPPPPPAAACSAELRDEDGDEGGDEDGDAACRRGGYGMPCPSDTHAISATACVGSGEVLGSGNGLGSGGALAEKAGASSQPCLRSLGSTGGRKTQQASRSRSVRFESPAP